MSTAAAAVIHRSIIVCVNVMMMMMMTAVWVVMIPRDVSQIDNIRRTHGVTATISNICNSFSNCCLPLISLMLFSEPRYTLSLDTTSSVTYHILSLMTPCYEYHRG